MPQQQNVILLPKLATVWHFDLQISSGKFVNKVTLLGELKSFDYFDPTSELEGWATQGVFSVAACE